MSEIFTNDSQQSPEFHKLDLVTMTTVLLDAPTAKEQNRVLEQFRIAPPAGRRSHLLSLLRSMVEAKRQYDPEVMISVVDLLATDPDPEATKALLNALPNVARAARSGSKQNTAFRGYFYSALMTRRRDVDRDAWKAAVATFDFDTLIGLLLDPAAAPVAAQLKPFKRIDRLPRRERSAALRSLIWEGSTQYSLRALGMLVGLASVPDE